MSTDTRSFNKGCYKEVNSKYIDPCIFHFIFLISCEVCFKNLNDKINEWLFNINLKLKRKKSG